MNSEFSFVNTYHWRSWERILGTNAALATAAGAVGYAYAGSSGGLAVIPFAFNIIKSGVSRILAENAWIESRYGFIVTEIVTTAAIVAITVLALSILTPLSSTALLYATAEIALPMLVETLATQLTTPETVEEAAAKMDEQKAQEFRRCHAERKGRAHA